MNLYKALRTIALRDVLTEPPEYHLRHIFRWYSRTFHVPLPEVSNLDLEHVLQAFYETKYEDMDEEAREEERKILMESDEARRARLLDEDRAAASDYQFQKEAEEMFRLQQEAEAAAKTATDKAAKPIVPRLVNEELPEANLMAGAPIAPVVHPEINMSFATDDEFQALLERDAGGGDDDPRDGNLPLKPPQAPTR